MKQDDFDLFAGIIKQRSGLALAQDKAYLLESRLPRVSRKYNHKTLEDLAKAIRDKREDALMNDIAEALTINESYFFRDSTPFDQLRKTLLPQLMQDRATKRQIRIWSAGTAGGQEAYSLAMICSEEAAKLIDYKIDILATDLSREMIERAKTGTFSQIDVQRGMPIAMLLKYFTRNGEVWQVHEDIRKMVQFRTLNLLHDFGAIGTFDVIFCRNVLSYFDQPGRQRVLNALASVLAPDGFLFLGKNEIVGGLTDKLKDAGQGFFTLNNGASADIRHTARR